MLRHLTIGQTLSIKRNGGLVEVAPLHKAMLDSGISSELLYTASEDGIEPPSNSIKVDSVLGNPFYFGWKSAARIKSAIQRADVVHVHGLYTYLNFLAGLYCHRLGKALIYHPHGTLAPQFLRSGRLKKGIALWTFERRNFSNMTAWRALTQIEAEQISNFVPGAKVFVVPNGIAIPHATARTLEIHPKLGLHSKLDKRVFLFLSRVSAVKGLDLLLEAWRCMGAERINCELWIAGTDRDGTQLLLQKWIDDHEVTDVRMVGAVSDEEKQWLFRSADVFVLPSRGEGQSPAVLEAMSYGKPVLVTKTCYFPEVVAAGAGYECDLSVAGLEAELKNFVSKSDEELEMMGARGRMLVTEKHDIRTVAKNLAIQTASALHEQQPKHQ